MVSFQGTKLDAVKQAAINWLRTQVWIDSQAHQEAIKIIQALSSWYQPPSGAPLYRSVRDDMKSITKSIRSLGKLLTTKSGPAIVADQLKPMLINLIAVIALTPDEKTHLHTIPKTIGTHPMSRETTEGTMGRDWHKTLIMELEYLLHISEPPVAVLWTKSLVSEQFCIENNQKVDGGQAQNLQQPHSRQQPQVLQQPHSQQQPQPWGNTFQPWGNTLQPWGNTSQPHLQQQPPFQFPHPSGMQTPFQFMHPAYTWQQAQASEQTEYAQQQAHYPQQAPQNTPQQAPSPQQAPYPQQARQNTPQQAPSPQAQRPKQPSNNQTEIELQETKEELAQLKFKHDKLKNICAVLRCKIDRFRGMCSTIANLAESVKEELTEDKALG